MCRIARSKVVDVVDMAKASMHCTDVSHVCTIGLRSVHTSERVHAVRSWSVNDVSDNVIMSDTTSSGRAQSDAFELRDCLGCTRRAVAFVFVVRTCMTIDLLIRTPMLSPPSFATLSVILCFENSSRSLIELKSLLLRVDLVYLYILDELHLHEPHTSIAVK